MTFKDKKQFIEDTPFTNTNFTMCKLDKSGNWVDLEAPDDIYLEYVPVIDKSTKATKIKGQEKAIFKTFSNGMNSARDDWAYDLNKRQLEKKANFFMRRFNTASNAMVGETYDVAARIIDPDIKWSRDLINKARSGKKLVPNSDQIGEILYRPFFHKFAYLGDGLIDVKSLASSFFPGGQENVAIAIDRGGQNFSALAIKCVPDWHFLGDTTYFGLSRFADGMKSTNLTDWALLKFRKHYGDKAIMSESVFNYVYAVLNDTSFVTRFKSQLCYSLPRIPLYDNFWQWAKWGQSLMDLHLNFLEAKSDRRLLLHQHKGLATEPAVRLDLEEGRIVLDDCHSFEGLKADMVSFKLGNRSPIEWALEASSPPRYSGESSDKAILQKNYATYDWPVVRKKLIETIPKLATISKETAVIRKKMALNASGLE